jgi:hypothetical protein
MYRQSASLTHTSRGVAQDRLALALDELMLHTPNARLVR